MFKSHPVLIVSSNPAQGEQIAELVRRCRLSSVLAPTLTAAHQILAKTKPLLVFCSDELNDSNLSNSIQMLRAESGVPVIALSRLAEWEPYMQACSAGAFDYIACPPEPKESRRVLSSALHQFRREHPRARQHAA